MTYRISGLAPDSFAGLFGQVDSILTDAGAVRVTATTKPGYPCRVTLKDAEPGETLILLNHVSHDVATPFRSSYAIYVREAATEAATHLDSTPPVFEGRTLALRAFDAQGMLTDAALAPPGQADARIRELFANDAVAYIHAHNAAPGCFAARVDRA